MREHLLDRISINLSADVPPTFDDRVAAVDIATRFQVAVPAALLLLRNKRPVGCAACHALSQKLLR